MHLQMPPSVNPNQSKPNTVGIKNWVLCGKSGRALDFEIYQGARTGIPVKNKHLGLGAAVVVRLADTIPEQQIDKLIFDNKPHRNRTVESFKGQRDTVAWYN